MRALIVDDDATIVEVIRDEVDWNKLGIFDVQTAYDVGNAREILEHSVVDIVISDIEMPKESGLELLKWYYENGYKGKFLLLTSHEKFSYATKALEYQAVDYLLKPFNLKIMEMVLKKNISILEKERRMEQSAEYGQWFLDNISAVKLSFLENLVSGRISADEKSIQDNIQIRKLDLNAQGAFRLVVTRVTNTEQDDDQHGHSLVRFILMNFHSEILCGALENERVICYERKNSFLLVTVCDDQPEQTLVSRCTRLIKKCGSMLEATITCCISRVCRMDEFEKTYYRLEKIQESNVIFYGEAFFESQVNFGEDSGMPVLDLKAMEGLLEKKEKKALLEYLKKELEDKIKLQVLNEQMLHIVRQEFQQAVYTYLANRGVQISRLLNDWLSIQIAEKAEQSVVNMIRWANYLLERVFEFEEEIQKSQTIIEKINVFIRTHYREDIGRNEIGAEFHLVPEYLARLYKRKTGKSIKDYINEYRIEQAKILLKDSEMRISDVSAEVGIDNISYFSTLFKKNTGVSPNEFRKI